MDWSEIGMELIVSLVPVLVPVLTGLIIALFSYGIAYLRARVADIKNETARKSLEAALAEAEVVGTDAVKATSQKFTDAIKAASADGKLTKDEIREAMLKAKYYFLTNVSEGALDVLMAAKGPIDNWLEDFLEAKLYDVKTAKGKVNALANPPSSGQVNSGQ